MGGRPRRGLEWSGKMMGNAGALVFIRITRWAALALIWGLAAGCVPAGPVDRPEPDRLVGELVATGSSEALLELTQRLSVEEISAALKALPRGAGKVGVLAEADGARHAVAAFGPPGEDHPGSLAVAVDSGGTLHAVHSRRKIVAEPDYLGNQQRWLSGLWYQKCAQGTWSEPEAILGKDFYADDLRLLVDAQDTLWLLASRCNFSAKEFEGLAPGKIVILLARKPKAGKWSAPERCITDALELHHGYDACFDDAGRLHLVWAEWKSNQELELIRHRVRGADGWGPEEALPAADGRNLMDPLVRWLDGTLWVFAAGQTSDSRRIGTCAARRGADGWSLPALLLDGTDFWHSASPAGSSFLLEARHRESETESSYRLFRHDAKTGGVERAGAMVMPGTIFSSSFSWRPPAVGWGPNDVPHILVGSSGVLYLVRPVREGRAEAVCVYAGRTADSEVPRQWLSIRGKRLSAVWLSCERTRPEGAKNERDERREFALRSLECDVPEQGWTPLADLTIRLRPGVGLTRSDRCLLGARILLDARSREKALDLPGAVERYYYATANFSEWDAPRKAWQRLMDLDQAGVTEVRRFLLKRAAADRSNRELIETLKMMGAEPDSPAAEELLRSPPQDKETIRALIDKWDRPTFTVRLAAGQEAVIVADRERLRGTYLSLEQFVQLAGERLKGKPAAGLGDVEVYTIHVRRADGAGMPPMEFRLKDLASFTIRAAPEGQ
jgi:hypothetical protein